MDWAENRWLRFDARCAVEDIGEHPDRLATWVQLLSRAAWEKRTVGWRDLARTLEPGELTFQVRALSDTIGIPKSNLQRHLNYLEKTDRFEKERGPRATFARIKNWSAYQLERAAPGAWIRLPVSWALGVVGKKSERLALIVHLACRTALKEDRQVIWNGELRELRPNELFLSERELSRKFRIKRATFQRFLEELSSWGHIRAESGTDGVIVSFCNWERIWIQTVGAGPPLGHNRDADGTQVNHPPGTQVNHPPGTQVNHPPTVRSHDLPHTQEPAAEPPGEVCELNWHELAGIWNQERGKKLPEVRSMSEERISAARSRFMECPSRRTWRRVIGAMAKSSFCTGGSKSGWKADFDFLLRKTTRERVLEGQYGCEAEPEDKAPMELLEEKISAERELENLRDGLPLVKNEKRRAEHLARIAELERQLQQPAAPPKKCEGVASPSAAKPRIVPTRTPHDWEFVESQTDDPLEQGRLDEACAQFREIQRPIIAHTPGWRGRRTKKGGGTFHPEVSYRGRGYRLVQFDDDKWNPSGEWGYWIHPTDEEMRMRGKRFGVGPVVDGFWTKLTAKASAELAIEQLVVKVEGLEINVRARPAKKHRSHREYERPPPG
jgi:hypothetical protein